MNFPLVRFISQRFTQSFRKERFLTFTKAVALGSVMLGSMALVIALSVLDGFEEALRENAVKFTSHIQLKGLRHQPLEESSEVLSLNKKFPQVKAVAPVIEREGLVRARKNVEGVLIRGMRPGLDITNLKNNIREGSFAFASDSSYEVILGRRLARKLEIGVGDSLLLTTITESDISPESGVIPTPNFDFLRVNAIYETGMSQYDDVYIYVPLGRARKIFAIAPDAVNSYEIVLHDANDAPEMLRKIENYLGYPYYGLTVFELHSAMFAWIELQKEPIPLVLGLISIVAIFNVLTTLLIGVVEKTHSIGILRSIGMKRRDILGIFIFQGVGLAFVGSMLGCAAGILLCYLQKEFHLIQLQGEIYFLDSVPIAFHAWHYIAILSTSLVLALLATLIPALIATRISPTRALRFR